MSYTRQYKARIFSRTEQMVEIPELDMYASRVTLFYSLLHHLCAFYWTEGQHDSAATWLRCYITKFGALPLVLTSFQFGFFISSNY